MQRAGRSISHSPGRRREAVQGFLARVDNRKSRAQFAKGTNERTQEGSRCDIQLHVHRANMPAGPTTLKQPCSARMFFLPFSVSPPFAFFHPLVYYYPFPPLVRGALSPRSRTRRRLRYFFIMHTFAGAIAISFGLVSALSARKSIFTVAEHQRENVGEAAASFSLSLPRSDFLSLSDARTYILGDPPRSENHAQP